MFHLEWFSQSQSKTVKIIVQIMRPQLKWYTHVTHVCKSKKQVWHQTTQVHMCEIKAPHTYTYPYETFIMKF